MNKKKIAVIGLWHLGCVISSCLADIGHQVIAYDSDENRIEQLKKGIAPLYEPGLNELIQKQIIEGNISFTNCMTDLADAEFIWITVDTKLDDNDNCDVNEIVEIMKMFGTFEHMHNYIVSSQLPVGSCEKLLSYVESENCKIACIPENFQLGKAIEYFHTTNFWVIGSDDEEYADKVKKLLEPVYSEPIICSLETAEMLKHSINSFFATIISFSNALSELAVHAGADAYKVVEIMKQEPRIKNGKLPLMPGPWFSGGTLARDVKVLSSLQDEGSSEAEKFFQEVLAVNNARCDYLLDRVFENKDVSKLKVAVLGIIYKNGTNTLRRSPGMQIIEKLYQRNVKSISIYDPLLVKDDINLDKYGETVIYDTIEEALNTTDIALLVRDDIIACVDEKQLEKLLEGKVLLDIPNSIRQVYGSCKIIKPGINEVK
jgi:UDPglucose 6-dehydrogenase